ncbi:phospholipase C/P1 nuclease domain-containing protein [Lasiosphaeris hirsuta]|uniref:Phospholipase C/P1 nuclease domain-containing protein n=1 Tax=Lasiosphaeris hirsuta TaxID=260670 RepID=A0AA40B939_9PEZI|nr:phospholipase C/P1 nuclease domain-containing protein [Lasiosphaeris hirsuta]
MKLSTLAIGATALPAAQAWGGFGHITVAYIASNFVSKDTASFFQGLLRNDTQEYLAGVATWADSARYSKFYHFSGIFHFIDAKDSPPSYCGIDLERDCKEDGCVVSAIQNYTTRLLDPTLPVYEHVVASKFLIHFIGDIHQPLHTEDVARGGNGIHVKFNGVELNLHHVWDTSIAEKLVGHGRRRLGYAEAKNWADTLTTEINAGKFNTSRDAWLEAVDLADPTSTALKWATEGNAYVCTTVLPEGPEAIVGQELGGDYYEKAAPVIELQVAKAGYRLAAWLDLIVARISSQSAKMGDL